MGALAVLTMTPMWRCWIGQIPTPRYSALTRTVSGVGVVLGVVSMVNFAEALACDVVDAYRFHVLGFDLPDQSPLVMKPPVKRISRYAREPVI
jgi:hypothetical protein